MSVWTLIFLQFVCCIMGSATGDKFWYHLNLILFAGVVLTSLITLWNIT